MAAPLKKIFSATILFFLAMATISFAASTYYQVNNTQNSTVNEWGTCKRVTNNTGKSLFIPTKTAAEWNAFVSNKPSSVTLGTCTCSLPWGGTLNDGSSVAAYQSNSVSCGGTCASQTRTCSGNILSGSYAYSTCSVAACASCSLPWGGTLAHGSSVTAYQSSSVACSSSCVSQTRTCNNGTLSGTYTNRTCTVAAPVIKNYSLYTCIPGSCTPSCSGSCPTNATVIAAPKGTHIGAKCAGAILCRGTMGSVVFHYYQESVCQ